VIAPDGNVFFMGVSSTAAAARTTWNDRALFHGSSRSTLRMVVRGGEQTPDMRRACSCAR
jgi:hypothetical protein